ncbi:hypothetical protein K461DRAFT_290679 [Myriangium duriaei CBS 260.36]|uniref:Thioesterase domain-containing protein n=1 Tax=Myriangium duriaei CBS 260.36 TaxID=1168546 RepID=A0A9P4J6M0_9PEZI|nr:hypothetical protein K461DRAFT_290679 [Myriangium duriaei CBS 260.36]
MSNTAVRPYIKKALGALKDQDIDSLTPMQRMHIILNNVEADDGRFFAPLFKGGLKLLEASSDKPGQARTLWEFDNTAYWANNSSNLHGGAHSTIFDILTSFTTAVIARPGFWLLGGVSRTLNVTYLRPAPSGEPMLIECEIIHAGQRLALMKATMRKKSDGAIISICEHNKVNADPPVDSKL